MFDKSCAETFFCSNIQGKRGLFMLGMVFLFRQFTIFFTKCVWRKFFISIERYCYSKLKTFLKNIYTNFQKMVSIERPPEQLCAFILPCSFFVYSFEKKRWGKNWSIFWFFRFSKTNLPNLRFLFQWKMRIWITFFCTRRNASNF